MHCTDFFIPDACNRAKQRYCEKPDCRQESKAASQRAWSSKPANADYFKGADNIERTRAWRRAHPGYSQRKKGGRPRRRVALQEDWKQQPAVLVGLVAHLTGLALQEDIDPILRSMHSHGRVILGIDVRRPDYGKTTDRSRTGAAHAAPI